MICPLSHTETLARKCYGYSRMRMPRRKSQFSTACAERSHSTAPSLLQAQPLHPVVSPLKVTCINKAPFGLTPSTTSRTSSLLLRPPPSPPHNFPYPQPQFTLSRPAPSILRPEVNKPHLHKAKHMPSWEIETRTEIRDAQTFGKYSVAIKVPKS